jgi:hypothetical protein
MKLNKSKFKPEPFGKIKIVEDKDLKPQEENTNDLEKTLEDQIEIQIVNEKETDFELTALFAKIPDREASEVTNPSTPYRTVTGHYDAHHPPPIKLRSSKKPNQSINNNCSSKMMSPSTHITYSDEY